LRSIYYSNKFKKDYKLLVKRGNEINLLVKVVEMLANDVELDLKYSDHALHGSNIEIRDCHIQNDWILLYIKEGNDQLQLLRTGSHADLFK
jgi:mRNA interferase YafQ